MGPYGQELLEEIGKERMGSRDTTGVVRATGYKTPGESSVIL